MPNFLGYFSNFFLLSISIVSHFAERGYDSALYWKVIPPPCPQGSPITVACIIGSFVFPCLCQSPWDFSGPWQALCTPEPSEEHVTSGALSWSFPHWSSGTSSGKWGNHAGQSERSLSTWKGKETHLFESYSVTAIEPTVSTDIISRSSWPPWEIIPMRTLPLREFQWSSYGLPRSFWYHFHNFCYIAILPLLSFNFSKSIHILLLNFIVNGFLKSSRSSLLLPRFSLRSSERQPNLSTKKGSVIAKWLLTHLKELLITTILYKLSMKSWVWGLWIHIYFWCSLE